MVSAPVELSSYDPAWSAKFEAEKAFLTAIIGQWLWGNIEHVGSTALQGGTLVILSRAIACVA